MKNGHGYDLSEGKTGLKKGDYLFLQRFLDATKANMFFAKGIIMVEGATENILIPVIADILGYPLEKYGVSIVNVGGTAFLRYSRIMVRADESTIGIPLSVVTDCDVKPYDINPATKEKIFNEKANESRDAEVAKNQKYTIGSVRCFTSPRWTLEYCLAMSCLSEDFHKAVHYGKRILNASAHIALTEQKIEDADCVAASETDSWRDLSQGEMAYKIYSLMMNEDGTSGLKAIVAQCLASIIRWKTSVIPVGITQEKMFDFDLYRYMIDEQKKAELKARIEEDLYLEFIVKAIKYAAGESV